MATIFITDEKPFPIKLVIDRARFMAERPIIDAIKTSIASRKRTYDPNTRIWGFEVDQLRTLMLIAFRVRGGSYVWLVNCTDRHMMIGALQAACIDFYDSILDEWRFSAPVPQKFAELVLLISGRATSATSATSAPVTPPQQSDIVEVETRILHVERRLHHVRFLVKQNGKLMVLKCGMAVFEQMFKDRLTAQESAAQKLVISLKNHYDTLGVTLMTSSEDIKAAWRKKIRFLHPDVCKLENASDAFRAIQNAYEVLSDTRRRKIYDLSLQITRDSGLSPIVLVKPIEGIDYRLFCLVNLFDAKMTVDLLNCEVRGIASLNLVIENGQVMTGEFRPDTGATQIPFSGNVTALFSQLAYSD